MSSKKVLMQKVKKDVTSLKSSPLYKYRLENSYLPVLGAGSYEAEVVFVGEAPGKNEAISGRPFCGRAGEILDEMLKSINLKREDIYITNIVKDRPPKNRDPKPKEIDLYAPFLERELDIIKPKVVATLGRLAMTYLLEKYGAEENVGKISDLHGKVVKIKMSEKEIYLMPLYHPAATIYNQKLKTVLLDDFKKLQKQLKKLYE